MVLECRNQPLKGIYLGYQLISTTFLRVPIWSLWYVLPAMRPVSAWSWKDSVVGEVLCHIMQVLLVTGPILQPDHRAIVPSKEAIGVWVEAAPSELVQGDLKIWASISSVTPERIPGFWYSRSGTPPLTQYQPGEKVFYFLHGGGYAMLSAHPQGFSVAIPRSLIELDQSVPRAFALEYRLSSTHPLPERFQFPTALLDSLSGYHYLVNEIGYEPSDIIIVGDSAGGNLALALCRYLVEHRGFPETRLPAPPGGLILLSPWVDLSDSHDWPGSSSLTFHMDSLDPKSLSYFTQAFLGSLGPGVARLNRYISPASLHPSVQAHFQGFPRTFIVAGALERLLDQIRTLRNKMVLEMGEEKVTYFEAPNTCHDHLVLSWHPQSPPTWRAIAAWLSEAP